MFTDGETGTVCNSATVDSNQSDPVPSDNDTGPVCVSVIQVGTCNSLQDLLQQVAEGDIAANRQNQLEKFLQTTIAASNARQRNTVLQRLAVFIKQVQTAEAQGAMDSETAAGLISCAQALRQQFLAGTQGRTTQR
jgi:hypothetical protein